MSANRMTLRVTGYGGQGVILSTYILGKAACIYSDFHSTMTQSFGPEARGSSCAAQLVIDKDRVLSPYAGQQDVLIAMSQEGYVKYAGELKKNALLVYEKELVTPQTNGQVRAFGVPATRLASEKVGKVITVNIIMVGFFAAISDVLGREAIEQAVKASVPAGTEKLNMLAFQTGYDYFQEHYTE